jgi:signal transduction histidine kinase
MLDIAKADIQFEPVLRQALENVAAQAHSKRVTVQVQSTLSTLYADEHRLAQVLVNLLTNSIRLANPGGQVVVRAEHTSDGATISVSDSGSGLSEELKRTIFERFRQIRPQETSAQESGSGLGLSICKALVNLHGGLIWVDSELGRGSKFTFTVPDQKQAARSQGSSQGPQHTQNPQQPQDRQQPQNMNRQSGENGGFGTS